MRSQHHVVFGRGWIDAGWASCAAKAAWRDTILAPCSLPLIDSETDDQPDRQPHRIWWEEFLTFAVVTVIFVTVVGSVEGAQWADGLPSLWPLASLGLAMGAVLSRPRWSEGWAHLLALLAGAAATLGQMLALVPGETIPERLATLAEHFPDRFQPAIQGSDAYDQLPEQLLAVSLGWLASYLSAWAVFRLRSAWPALVLGGAALSASVFYGAPGSALTCVVFFVGGSALVACLHIARRARTWKDFGVPYPSLLSLSVLHAAFWVALLLVGVAWLLPQANEVDPLRTLWQRAAPPAPERIDERDGAPPSPSKQDEDLEHGQPVEEGTRLDTDARDDAPAVPVRLPLGDESGPGPGGGQQPPPINTGTAEPGGGPEDWSRQLFGAVVGPIFGLLSLAAIRHLWRRGLAGLEPPARLWGQTIRLASWLGVGPSLSQTPREFATALQMSLPGMTGVDVLADAYVRHRFGRGVLEEGERARLQAVWRAVRSGLLRQALKRQRLAPPPASA